MILSLTIINSFNNKNRIKEWGIQYREINNDEIKERKKKIL